MATEKEYLQAVQGSIEKELSANIAAIPPGFDNKRFALNCIAMIKDNLAKWKKDYANVPFENVIAAFMKGAFLDLDFFNRECYLIPYGKEVNFQTDYKGEIKLAKKYSRRKIKDIYAKLVRQGDAFQPQIINGVQSVNFTPKPFNDGDIVGVFAVVLYEDGGMNYEDMSKADVEKIRQAFSKAKDSPAWTKTPGEMYKKTVLRRLLKMVDLHFDNTEQQSAFEQGGDVNFNRRQDTIIDVAPSEIKDPFAENAATDEKEAEPIPNITANDQAQPEASQQAPATSQTVSQPPDEFYDAQEIDITSLVQ